MQMLRGQGRGTPGVAKALDEDRAGPGECQGARGGPGGRREAGPQRPTQMGSSTPPAS